MLPRFFWCKVKSCGAIEVLYFCSLILAAELLAEHLSHNRQARLVWITLPKIDAVSTYQLM